jgi:hypothetical protein
MRINMLCCLPLAIFLVVWGSDQIASASEIIIPGPACPGVGALRSIAERNVDAMVWPLFVIRWMGNTTSNGGAGAGEHTHSPQFLRIVSLLELSSGDRVVFLRNGMVADSTAYTIVDPNLVKALWEFFAPIREVAERHEELSRRPNELGRLTGEYARSVAALSLRRPMGMTIEAFDAALDRSDDVDSDQGDWDADFKRDISQLRAQKRALAAARDKEQAERITALKVLFEEERRLNDEAQTKARALLDEAVTSGAAKPIEP